MFALPAVTQYGRYVKIYRTIIQIKLVA